MVLELNDVRSKDMRIRQSGLLPALTAVCFDPIRRGVRNGLRRCGGDSNQKWPQSIASSVWFAARPKIMEGARDENREGPESGANMHALTLRSVCRRPSRSRDASRHDHDHQWNHAMERAVHKGTTQVTHLRVILSKFGLDIKIIQRENLNRYATESVWQLYTIS
jgi:hypothetical protein